MLAGSLLNRGLVVLYIGLVIQLAVTPIYGDPSFLPQDNTGLVVQETRAKGTEMET